MKKTLWRNVCKGIHSVTIRGNVRSGRSKTEETDKGNQRGCPLRYLFCALAALGLAGCAGRDGAWQVSEWTGALSETGLVPDTGWETQTDEKAQTGQTAETQTEGEAQTETQRVRLFVHVCGQVVRPGVYELDGEARVCDALKAAGGLTSEADQAALNQAAPLTDGQQVYAPSREEVSSGAYAGSAAGGGAFAGGSGQPESLVNINLASAEELQTLPGIGESRAADIVAYRELNGGFSAIEDIMKVSGIKDALFNRIKDKIAV